MGGSGRRESDAVVHTGTLREMVADDCDGVLMGRMSRVGSHVIESVDASGLLQWTSVRESRKAIERGPRGMKSKEPFVQTAIQRTEMSQHVLP